MRLLSAFTAPTPSSQRISSPGEMVRDALRNPRVELILTVIAVLLLGFTLWFLYQGWKEERSHPSPQSASEPQPPAGPKIIGELVVCASCGSLVKRGDAICTRCANTGYRYQFYQ